MVKSAVGAELLARNLEHSSMQPVLHYWRDGDHEVDFVYRSAGSLFAFEVKSGNHIRHVGGLDAFCSAYKDARPAMIGTGGIPLEEFFVGLGT